MGADVSYIDSSRIGALLENSYEWLREYRPVATEICGLTAFFYGVELSMEAFYYEYKNGTPLVVEYLGRTDEYAEILMKEGLKRFIPGTLALSAGLWAWSYYNV